MKKLILGVTTMIVLFTSSTGSSQAITEGNVIIDGYYGFPNLYTTVFKTAYANSGTEEDLKISGNGPAGLRFEYLLTNKLGLGIDFGISNTSITYTENNYQYDFSTQRIGAMVTFNYHFIENENVDFYGVFGAGYKNRTFKFESTDPDYEKASISAISPVAMRLGIGVRYFFTENIGLNVGAGFGHGGLLNAGISAKF